MELYMLYIIGFRVIEIAICFFSVLGNAVLGPENFKEASIEGIELSLKMFLPVLIVLVFAYFFNTSIIN